MCHPRDKASPENKMAGKRRSALCLVSLGSLSDLGENSQMLRNPPPTPAYFKPSADVEGGRATDQRQIHTLQGSERCWCQANRETHGWTENTGPTQMPTGNLRQEVAAWQEAHAQGHAQGSWCPSLGQPGAVRGSEHELWSTNTRAPVLSLSPTSSVVWEKWFKSLHDSAPSSVKRVQ